MSVSRCGFYAWLKRPPCRRNQEDERLRVAIRAAHTKTRRTYSAKRLKTELEAEGVIVGRDRIVRLRREEGIRCIQKCKFKATTHSNHRLPVAGLILHSDLGSQYCAHSYRKLIEQFKLRASMSRRGNCYDNAPMESFGDSLKNELVCHRRYATRTEVETSIREYIEIFYNRQRCHSRLGYLAPAVFAQKFSKQQAGI